MKKKYRGIALIIALLGTLTACSGPAASSQQAESTPASSMAEMSYMPAEEAPSMAEETQQQEPVLVFLPAGSTAVEGLLEQFAAEQGLKIEIKSTAKGALYTKALLEQMEPAAEEETPPDGSSLLQNSASTDTSSSTIEPEAANKQPDIFWLEDEAAARELLAGGYLPADLLARGVEPQLASLAAMTPESTRLLDSEKVYGFPMGVYAEGTLVNLNVLASLLNTDDLAGLQRNLRDASYKEWKVMIEAIEAFLKQPKKYGIKLAGQNYTLPRYRPENATALRGVYANSTSAPGALLVNNLGATYASAYLNPADLLDADSEHFAAAMEAPLKALYEQLEFESKHFTTQDGPLSRGEAFTTAPRITDSDARTLFASGASLLYKADSREGLKLEQEYPELSGKLALIPGKLPIEDEAVAEMNGMYGLSSGGYLCVNPRSTQRQAIGRLLVQCFSSPAGQETIEQQLYLLPHTDVYPENLLLQQVDEALNLNYAYILPALQEDLITAQSRIGEWVFSELLGKEEWEEEDFEQFMVAAQSVLTAHPDKLEGEMLVGGDAAAGLPDGVTGEAAVTPEEAQAQAA